MNLPKTNHKYAKTLNIMTKKGAKHIKTKIAFKPYISSLLKFTGINPKPAKITNKSRNGKYANEKIIKIRLNSSFGFPLYFDKVFLSFISLFLSKTMSTYFQLRIFVISDNKKFE